MRVSEDLQGGDAVLCMPRDLFEVGGHSGTSTTFAGGTGSQKKDEKSTRSQRLAPPRPPAAPILSHDCTSMQDDGPSPRPVTSKNLPLLNEGPCECRVMGIAYSSSPNLSLDGTSTPGVSRNWRFEVVASLRADACSLSSDVIAAIDFDETGCRFATGGIARKMRVCSYTALVSAQELGAFPSREENIEEDDFEEGQLLGPHGSGHRSFQNSRSYCGFLKRKKPDTEGVMVRNHNQAALRVISTPAKLSSLKWRPLGSNVIGCGDYDGVVTEWDVEQGLCLSERYEHSGQRVWSVDYSSWFPTLCASASGDGTVRLWTLNCERSVGIIRSPGRNSICCAEFNSDGPHRVAVACADSNVYMYDVRRLDSWLSCLQGHERAASYVRFLGSEELVSASIDSTIKVWDVSNVQQQVATASNSTRTVVRVGGVGVDQDEISWTRVQSQTSRAGAGVLCRPRKSFNSHRNVKNFVGLSVWK